MRPWTMWFQLANTNLGTLWPKNYICSVLKICSEHRIFFHGTMCRDFLQWICLGLHLHATLHLAARLENLWGTHRAQMPPMSHSTHGPSRAGHRSSENIALWTCSKIISFWFTLPVDNIHRKRCLLPPCSICRNDCITAHTKTLFRSPKGGCT